MSNCLYQQKYIFVGFKTLCELKNFSIKNKPIYNLLFIPNKITTLCFMFSILFGVFTPCTSSQSTHVTTKQFLYYYCIEHHKHLEVNAT